MARCVAVFILALSVCLAAAPASAVSLADGKLFINGSGNWTYARTDGNLYYGDEDGDWQSGEISLSFIGKPAQNVTVQLQPFFEFGEEGVEPEVDVAFGQYDFSDKFRLRLGLARHPFGIYTPIYDLGTQRPFHHLSTTIYNEHAGIVAESYAGVGVTGYFALASGWGLDYDLYGGALSVEMTQPWESGDDEGVAGEEGEEGMGGEVEATELENLVGAKLVVHTPVEGLSFGGSVYTGEVTGDSEGETAEGERNLSWGAQLEYLTERILFRTEYASQSLEDDSDTQAAYAEAGWMVTKNLQLVARGEWGDVELADAELDRLGDEPDDALLQHQELAVGVNWWFSPDFVVKVSYHMADGLRFVEPEADDEGQIDEKTKLLHVGAAFSF